ncbi:MAG: hypothetical protein AB1483_09665 [Candidatus Zixiibacteriota bacterium]
MKSKVALMGLAVLTVVIACSDEETTDGPCRYVEYPGTATIVYIVDDSAGASICSNAVIVLFDFLPDDPTAPDRYLYPTYADTGRQLLVGTGYPPPENWVAGEGLTAGSEHRCVRSEIISGMCTPVVFTFSDIDYSSWTDSCQTP